MLPFISHSFQGPALDRILTHVSSPGSASISQSSFHRAMHLINLTLRNAQQGLFDGDAEEAAPILLRKSVSPSKRQHPTISQLLQSLGEDGTSDSIKCNLQNQVGETESMCKVGRSRKSESHPSHAYLFFYAAGCRGDAGMDSACQLWHGQAYGVSGLGGASTRFSFT